MIELEIVEENQAGEFFYSSNRYKAIGSKIYECLFNDPTVAHPIINTIQARLNNENDEILNIQVEYSPDSLSGSKIPLYPWQLSYSKKHSCFLFEEKIVFSFRVIFDGNKTTFTKSPVDQIKVLVIAPSAIDEEHGLLPVKSTIPSFDESLEAKILGDKIKIIDLYKGKETCSFQLMQEKVKTYKNIKPNIIHFDGHGVHRRWCNNPACSEYGKPCFKDGVRECSSCPEIPTKLEHPEGFLLFHDNDGKPSYISATKFVECIRDLAPQLVVIAACRSALTTEGRTVFGGIVQKLIHKNIPFVIGFQFNVTDESLKNFTKVFYDELLNNEKPLLESFYKASRAMEYHEWYKSVIFSTKDIPSEKLFQYDPHPYSLKTIGEPLRTQIPPKPSENNPYQKNVSLSGPEKKRPGEQIHSSIPKLSEKIIENYMVSRILAEVVICIYESFEDAGVLRYSYNIYKKAFKKIKTHYNKIEPLDPIPSEINDFYNILFSSEISNDARFTKYRDSYCLLERWIQTERITIINEMESSNDLYTPQEFCLHLDPILEYTQGIHALWSDIYQKFRYMYLL